MKRCEMDALVSVTRKILTTYYEDNAITLVSREEFNVLSKLSFMAKRENKYIFDNGEEIRVDHTPGFSCGLCIEETANGQKKYVVTHCDKTALAAITCDLQMFYKKIKLPQRRWKDERLDSDR